MTSFRRARSYLLYLKEVVNPDSKHSLPDQASGNSYIHNAAEINDVDSLRYLVEVLHCDPNLKTKGVGNLVRFGETPLHMAVKCNSNEAARYLLRMGADPTILRVPDQRSPLDLCDANSNKDLHFLLTQVSSLLEMTQRRDATPEAHSSLDQFRQTILVSSTFRAEAPPPSPLPLSAGSASANSSTSTHSIDDSIFETESEAEQPTIQQLSPLDLRVRFVAENMHLFGDVILSGARDGTDVHYFRHLLTSSIKPGIPDLSHIYLDCSLGRISENLVKIACGRFPAFEDQDLFEYYSMFRELGLIDEMMLICKEVERCTDVGRLAYMIDIAWKRYERCAFVVSAFNSLQKQWHLARQNDPFVTWLREHNLYETVNTWRRENINREAEFSSKRIYPLSWRELWDNRIKGSNRLNGTNVTLVAGHAGAVFENVESEGEGEEEGGNDNTLLCERVHAHLLVVTFEFFQAMWSFNGREINEWRESERIPVHGLGPGALKVFVMWLYTGKFTEATDPSDILDLLSCSVIVVEKQLKLSLLNRFKALVRQPTKEDLELLLLKHGGSLVDPFIRDKLIAHFTRWKVAPMRWLQRRIDAGVLRNVVYNLEIDNSQLQERVEVLEEENRALKERLRIRDADLMDRLMILEAMVLRNSESSSGGSGGVEIDVVSKKKKVVVARPGFCEEDSSDEELSEEEDEEDVVEL